MISASGANSSFSAEGIAGLYKGFWPSYLRMGSATVIISFKEILYFFELTKVGVYFI